MQGRCIVECLSAISTCFLSVLFPFHTWSVVCHTSSLHSASHLSQCDSKESKHDRMVGGRAQRKWVEYSTVRLLRSSTGQWPTTTATVLKVRRNLALSDNRTGARTVPPHKVTCNDTWGSSGRVSLKSVKSPVCVCALETAVRRVYLASTRIPSRRSILSSTIAVPADSIPKVDCD